MVSRIVGLYMLLVIDTHEGIQLPIAYRTNTIIISTFIMAKSCGSIVNDVFL